RLLNAHERVAYVNPSALRLLRIGKRNLLAPEDFDVRRHLLSLVADPNFASSELDRVWSSSEQDASTDLALANAAVQWLRVRCFPIRDDGGGILGRGVLLEDITLERASLEARSETLALAAHELKMPL